MAAITGIVFRKRIPLTATAGGLVMELWRVPASTAGDTQTLALPHIKTVLSITGIASYVAQTVDHAIDVTTSATVAASNFSDLIIIGTE